MVVKTATEFVVVLAVSLAASPMDVFVEMSAVPSVVGLVAVSEAFQVGVFLRI